MQSFDSFYVLYVIGTVCYVSLLNEQLQRQISVFTFIRSQTFFVCFGIGMGCSCSGYDGTLWSSWIILMVLFCFFSQFIKQQFQFLLLQQQVSFAFCWKCIGENFIRVFVRKAKCCQRRVTVDWVKVELSESLLQSRKKFGRAVSESRVSSNGMRRVCSFGLSELASKSFRQLFGTVVGCSVICGFFTVSCACLSFFTYGQSSRYLMRAMSVSRFSGQQSRSSEVSSGTSGRRSGRLVRQVMYYLFVCVCSSESWSFFCSGFFGRCQLVIIVTFGCSSYGSSIFLERSITTACSQLVSFSAVIRQYYFAWRYRCAFSVQQSGVSVNSVLRSGESVSVCGLNVCNTMVLCGLLWWRGFYGRQIQYLRLSSSWNRDGLNSSLFIGIGSFYGFSMEGAVTRKLRSFFYGESIIFTSVQSSQNLSSAQFRYGVQMSSEFGLFFMFSIDTRFNGVLISDQFFRLREWQMRTFGNYSKVEVAMQQFSFWRYRDGFGLKSVSIGLVIFILFSVNGMRLSRRRERFRFASRGV